jgi:hypothetical protein
MPKAKGDIARTLAESWTAPAASAAGEIGRPLVCIASTYTFHASFLESELLPRFLGLKFDETEGVRPFVVEREQALATARVGVLVDADHLDPSQTTLRWDQLPVRVPRGAQHSKIVLLVWENYARLIVSSANLTRSGYRRNREIAGVLDFFDHESSAPRKLIVDAMDFLKDLGPFIRVSEPAKVRWEGGLENARSRARSWRQMPVDFNPRERPRVTFVGGLPRRNGGVTQSPLEKLIELWGTKRASEITVVTPFVGDPTGTVDPVVEKLMQLPRVREAIGYLVVPGRPSEAEANRMVVALPNRFREAWASAWRIAPDDVPTYVVPLCRAGEKANRDLHAKGVLVSGEGTTLLLCGSSNFSPHGMGVGMANVEANLCYLDDLDTKRNGLTLENRLPVDWEEDRCEDPIWPDTAEVIEDEQSGSDRPLPAAFLWAVYNQRTAVLTVALDLSATFPAVWSLRWPGERSEDAPPLADQGYQPWPPPDGRIVLPLPASLRGANVAGLRLVWRGEDDALQSATLPVHIESGDDLLPPEEFRSLTADGILECLLSGRDPAEWVEAMERRQASGGTPSAAREFDSLRAVDTSSYVLYRTRRLGTALTASGHRLLRTVRTRDAMAYRLRQDPLGPRMLAEALVNEWQDTAQQNQAVMHDAAIVMFSLAEINLTLAHVARRITDAPLRVLFREVIEDIDRMCADIASRYAPPPNLQEYLRAVKRKHVQLLDATQSGRSHAN